MYYIVFRCIILYLVYFGLLQNKPLYSQVDAEGQPKKRPKKTRPLSGGVDTSRASGATGNISRIHLFWSASGHKQCHYVSYNTLIVVHESSMLLQAKLCDLERLVTLIDMPS